MTATIEQPASAPMVQRKIKLKEAPRLTNEEICPTPDYLAKCDGSLIAKPYRFRTDVDGFMVGGDRIEGADNIVVLGDSIVECLFVDEDGRLCPVIQSRLREAGYRVNVLNAGVTGATTLALLNVFLNKIIPMRPRMVVLMSNIMDTFAMTDVRSFWTGDPWVTTLDDPSADAGSEQREPTGADKQRILTLFAQAARAFGIHLILATTAHREEYDAFTSKHHTKDMHERNVEVRRLSNGATRSTSAALLLPLIDAEQIGSGNLFYDSFHLNATGAAVVGELIASNLAIQLSERTAR
jgi:lysophospholipase L1-like esterase